MGPLVQGRKASAAKAYWFETVDPLSICLLASGRICIHHVSLSVVLSSLGNVPITASALMPFE